VNFERIVYNNRVSSLI